VNQPAEPDVNHSTFNPKLSETHMTDNKTYDVIIIGGSYAGLSAAMSLGRSLRNVLVVDSGKPCNAPTPHSHNFLTHDGKTPAAIARIAREQLAAYETVQLRDDVAISGIKTAEGFTINFESGASASGKKLIFATGIKDQLLDIPGFAACWGISVIHCPYCHGYEFRGSETAILGNGETAMHYALLVSNLTKHLTILTNGKPEFSDEQKKKLAAKSIEVIESQVVEIRHEHGHLKHAVLADGRNLAFDAMYFRPPFTQHCLIPQSLGCELTEQGYLKVDAFQKTTIEGVFACGDNSSMMRSVANAVATGNFTGAVVNKELATEKF
jgi:thioredoxin reductase